MDQHRPDMSRRMLIACIAKGHAGSLQEIRKSMNGNLCRCGAYDHVVVATQDAAGATGSVRGG